VPPQDVIASKTAKTMVKRQQFLHCQFLLIHSLSPYSEVRGANLRIYWGTVYILLFLFAICLRMNNSVFKNKVFALDLEIL
jgi:hypothetical protein